MCVCVCAGVYYAMRERAACIIVCAERYVYRERWGGISVVAEGIFLEGKKVWFIKIRGVG